MENALVDDLPELVPFLNQSHPTGQLTVIEAGTVGCFPVKRVYFLHSIAPGAVRGSHAHKNLQQLIVPVSGSFLVQTEKSGVRTDFLMDSPSTGLFVKPFTWRTLTNFSEGAVCMVLASEHYDESDYIRDYAEFLSSGPRG